MAEKQNINAVAETLSRPWVHIPVGYVDDYCAYLVRFRGAYKFHSHNRDEMYLVLEGRIYIDFDDGRRIHLDPRESLVVQAGEVHRSGSEGDALVLMFKARDLFAE